MALEQNKKQPLITPESKRTYLEAVLTFILEMVQTTGIFTTFQKWGQYLGLVSITENEWLLWMKTKGDAFHKTEFRVFLIYIVSGGMIESRLNRD